MKKIYKIKFKFQCIGEAGPNLSLSEILLCPTTSHSLPKENNLIDFFTKYNISMKLKINNHNLSIVKIDSIF